MVIAKNKLELAKKERIQNNKRRAKLLGLNWISPQVAESKAIKRRHKLLNPFHKCLDDGKNKTLDAFIKK